MSYILEALKKSDQKRQKGQVPDLNTVQAELPPEEKKKALWPYLVVGILLLNAIVLAVVMRPDHSTPEPPAIVQNSVKQKSVTDQKKQKDVEPQPKHALSPVPQESIPATPVAQMDTDIAASQEVKNPLVTKELSADTATVSEPTVEEMNIDRDQKETQVVTIEEKVTDGIVAEGGGDIEEVAQDIVPEPGHIVPKEDSVIVAEPESMETSTLPDGQLEVSEINKSQQRQDTPPPPETSKLSEEKNRVKREPLHIMQLPSSLQGELPEIHISAHVYFEKKPASRLASINGKIMREGSSLAPNLRVEEITSDGVIFSYHEYLFHVPVF